MSQLRTTQLRFHHGRQLSFSVALSKLESAEEEEEEEWCRGGGGAVVATLSGLILIL